jgi:outer membrane biosynthesis protein TonB
VHFPHIVSASHEDFGWAAATAVAQWKFAPPQKNGEKVEVRMKTQVLFDARQLAAAD